MVYQRILTALDFSPGSETVFNQAVEIAQQNQATLMLLHCISSDSYLPYRPHDTFDVNPWASYSSMLTSSLEKEKELTIQKLSDYAQKAQNKGVQVEWQWEFGEAGIWIRKMSETWQADLIVLGRRGLSGLEQMLLGSVSNYVVQRVACSVILVPLKKS